MKFSKKVYLSIFLVIIIVCSGIIIGIRFQNKYDYWPTNGWKMRDGVDLGMNMDLIEEGIDKLAKTGTQAVLIIKDGYIIREEYFDNLYSEFQHNIFSVTKSFTSTLIGIAHDNGIIPSLDEKLLEILDEYSVENLDSNKKNITIQDLLEMRSGLPWSEVEPFTVSNIKNNYMQMTTSANWVQYVLDLKMDATPGEKWTYNTGGSHLLAAILDDYISVPTLQFAKENLFDKLGIPMINVSWTLDPQGIISGGSSLYLHIRDMAKLGLLYLRNGLWEDTQILTKSWIEAATNTITDFGGGVGYGLQWWTDPLNDYYYAAGYRGQYVIVKPDDRLITVFISDDATYPQLSIFNHYIMSAVSD